MYLPHGIDRDILVDIKIYFPKMIKNLYDEKDMYDIHYPNALNGSNDLCSVVWQVKIYFS